jgi:O-antigen ligase
LYVVWGCIVAAFFVNTAFAVVQVGCQGGGLYGLYQPGKGPPWTPSVDDLATTPNALVLRPIASPGGPEAHPAWASPVPDRPFLIGSLMGGPGAYLALGSLGLPLALAVTLQLLAPRGSREGLWARLSHAGQGSLVVLLCGMLLASAVLVGLLAGPVASLPFAIGLAVVGLPGAGATGLRWTAIGLTVLSILGLGGGAVLGEVWARLPEAAPPVRSLSLSAAATVWAEALAIAADFPLLGTGLGSFAAVEPFYKSQDAASTTAMSSLLQWWAESGVVGLALLSIGGGWCLFRLPGAVRRVGTADRSLVFGLIGAAASFSLYSAVHWTVELAAVAVAASAWGGTWNRWLAGGTDLFVERG